MPGHQTDKQCIKCAGKSHGHPGHAGGPSFFGLVPFLGAGQHRRGQKGAAHPRRQAVGQQEEGRIAGRHQGGGQESSRQQPGAPQPGRAGAAAVLQKAACRTAHTVGGHQHRKDQHGLPPGQTVSLHNRPLKGPPCRRDAGEQLHPRPGRQNVRSTVLFCHKRSLPCPFSMAGLH